MKPSSATGLSSFRPLNALNSIIHPPLPLTKGQSQQLLSLLKTSFREQLAAFTVEPPSNSQISTEPNYSPVDAHLNTVLKIPVFNIGSEAPSETSGKAEQVRVERFIRNPLEVYHELASQSVPTPSLAWAVLKRHTTNTLSLPKSELEDGWAVKAVLEVIKPLHTLSPRIHLEDKRLRQQIIRTLIEGGEKEVAAGMLNKPWLLHILPKQQDAKELLEIRKSLIQEVTKSIEEVHDLNTAASEFLRMVDSWQGDCEDVCAVNTNPFMKSGQYFLLRYVNQKDPAVARLRMNIYETCTPWIRSKFVKASLMLYYENNPYRLYGILMHETNYEKRAGITTICLELILSLVHHHELDKAHQVASLMRTKLIGVVAGLESDMVDEVARLLQSPSVDILTRLSGIVSESTRRFTNGKMDFLGMHWILRGS